VPRHAGRHPTVPKEWRGRCCSVFIVRASDSLNIHEEGIFAYLDLSQSTRLFLVLDE
jgi:hypothetical protein